MARFEAGDATVQALVAFVEKTKAKKLTDEQNQVVIYRLIDSMGCALLASNMPEMSTICDSILEFGGTPKCSVLGRGKTSPVFAGYLNSAMTRYLDFNDSFRFGGHPSDIIGGVIAVGEYAGKNGRDILQAIAIGTHVMLDFTEQCAINLKGFDFAVFAGIGATIACSILLDLTPEQLGHAISLNAVSNNILIGRSGRLATWKNLAAPTAVRNAILSVFSARINVSGPDPIFGGEQGFFKQVTGELKPELNAERDRTGDISVKPYAAVIHAQATIELGLNLHKQIAKALGTEKITPTIESIKISVCKQATKWSADKAKWRPENHETADHSLPFLGTLALCTGKYDVDSIDEGLEANDILDLTERVDITADPVFTEQYPAKLPARLEVKAGGRDFAAEVPAPMGHWSRPMPRDQIVEKYFANTTKVISRPRADAWLEKLRKFDRLETLDGLFNP